MLKQRIKARLGVVVAALVFSCMGCNRGTTRVLPPEVVGHWATGAPSYRGRFMELSPTYVIIGAGERGSPDVQTIEQVEAGAGDTGTLYTVHSISQTGVRAQIRFEFSPNNGGEIRIKNQTVVWKRREPEVPST